MLSNNLNHFDKAFQCRDNEEHRKGGRFATSSVYSNFGEVVDLSASGALIIKRRFKKTPSASVFILEIKHEEDTAVLNARLARKEKKNGIGQLVAVEFIDVTEEQHEAIKNIVRNSRNWRLLNCSEPDTDAA